MSQAFCVLLSQVLFLGGAEARDDTVGLIRRIPLRYLRHEHQIDDTGFQNRLYIATEKEIILMKFLSILAKIK